MNEFNIIVAIIGALGAIIGALILYMKERIVTQRDIMDMGILKYKAYEDRINFLVADNTRLNETVENLRVQFEILRKQNAYIPDLEAMRAQQEDEIFKLTERVESLEAAIAKTASQLRALTIANKVEIGEVIDILEDLEDNLIAE
jgi:uncharacterized coiled-coil protein SlyX